MRHSYITFTISVVVIVIIMAISCFAGCASSQENITAKITCKFEIIATNKAELFNMKHDFYVELLELSHENGRYSWGAEDLEGRDFITTYYGFDNTDEAVELVDKFRELFEIYEYPVEIKLQIYLNHCCGLKLIQENNYYEGLE